MFIPNVMKICLHSFQCFLNMNKINNPTYIQSESSVSRRQMRCGVWTARPSMATRTWTRRCVRPGAAYTTLAITCPSYQPATLTGQ